MLEGAADKNPQRMWREATYEYVAQVNAYVERGLRNGWENAGTHPEESVREPLAHQAVAAIRRGNATGELERLRDEWPPAHRPLIGILEKNGQSLPVACILPDESIVLRVGAPYERGQTVRIIGDKVQPVDGVGFFGRSPNRRYFGLARAEGIEIVDGWEGPRTAMCSWPTGLEDIPDGFDVKPLSKRPTPSRLIPFPGGDRVLLVSGEGIFDCSPDSVRRVLPTIEDLRESFTDQKESSDDELMASLDMEHGAVSHSGEMIAVGSQDSTHLIFDSDLKLLADVGCLSSYPHYAIFSQDDEMVAFNSCHFYNGITVGVPTNLLPGLKTEEYEPDPRVPTLEDSARVYAGVSRGKTFIVGNASGEVLAFDRTGNQLWTQFVGSSVGDIDLSPDGTTLVVTTYAGFVSIFRVDAGQQAPHQIGNGNNLETRRWIFWKNERTPLIW